MRKWGRKPLLYKMTLADQFIDMNEEQAFDLLRYVDDDWSYPSEHELDDVGCSMIDVNDDDWGF